MGRHHVQCERERNLGTANWANLGIRSWEWFVHAAGKHSVFAHFSKQFGRLTRANAFLAPNSPSAMLQELQEPVNRDLRFRHHCFCSRIAHSETASSTAPLAHVPGPVL